MKLEQQLASCNAPRGYNELARAVLEANYNTDAYLWQNQFKVDSALPNGGALLQLHDGMISNGYAVLARFKSNRVARQTLKSAGYSEVRPAIFHTRAARAAIARAEETAQ